MTENIYVLISSNISKDDSEDNEDDDKDSDDDDDEDDNGIADKDERKVVKQPHQSDPRIYTVLSDFKGEQDGDLSVQV